MSETANTTETSSNSQPESDADAAVVCRVKPALKPVLIRLGLVVVAAVVAIGVLFASPTLLGSRDVTNVALLVVQLLAMVALLRLLVRVFVLRQTEYVVTSDSVKRTYNLFLRSHKRQIPLDLVRSHELKQSRSESVLGHGTIRLNQGLGDLELENIPNPHEVYGAIREHTTSQ